MSILISIFKGILEVSLFASAMIALVLLVREIAKDRINIKIISILWLLVILRLCLPGMLESPVRVGNLFPAPTQAIAAATSPAPQNKDAYHSQNNPFGNPLADNEVAALREGNIQNQAAASTPQAIPFLKQAIAFLQSLDLWLVAATAWLLGSIIVLAWALRETLAFTWYIRKSSYPLTNRTILNIVAVHKKANRLRRTIQVSICPDLLMPITFGVLHPHILLPLHMTEQLSRAHIDTILLHEVCHIKRNDILKNYVCVLARALHWFNPLVWISMKQIRTDMEFACDQRVLSFIDAGQKVKYCESLLIAARFMKRRKMPQFVSPLCESKSNLKERILKMVTPQKKSIPTVIISITLAIIMLVACFTTACQPTPTKVAVNQGNGLMEAIDKGNAEQNTGNAVQNSGEKYNALEKWVETLTSLSGKVSTKFNATISVPDVTNYPSIRIVPEKFRMEDFRAVEKLFFPDCTYYSLDAPQTKEEIEQLILTTKKSINDPNSDFNTANLKDSDYKTIKQQKLDDIKTWEKQYQSAPSAADIKLTEVSDDLLKGDFQLNLKAVSKDGVLKGRISVNSTGENKNRNNSMSIEINLRDPSDKSNYEYRTIAGKERLLPPLMKKSADEAVETAKKTMESLGIENMQYSYYMHISEGDKEEYQVFFTKTYNGIPTNYATNGGQYSDYAAEYKDEVIQINVNDDGVIGFSWNSPSKEADVLSSNVKLMEFSKIQDIARNQLQYRFAWQEGEDDIKEKRVTISEIKLGMMRISIPNKVDEYMVVPVWDFYGNYDDVYPAALAEKYQHKANENGEVIVPNFAGIKAGSSVFTINAIDGSIIHRD